MAYIHPQAEYNSAVDLFSKRKYAAARDLFKKVAADPGVNSLIRTEAEFYEALCAVELFNNDSERLFENFISKNPESLRSDLSYFYLGNYYYRKKKYSLALPWFEKINPDQLHPDILTEYKFKLGHSYFEKDNYDKATLLLAEIKDAENKYTAPANYYYSHIKYASKNYETALQGFLKLKDHANFGPLVPYYLAQIYFLQGKYDEVIRYSPGLLDSANTKRVPEISRIIGEAFYRQKKYKEAVPYLEIFRNKSTRITRNDHYQMGFAYYMAGMDKESILHFKDVSAGGKDSLAQSANYHLAGAYLQMQNKAFARNAFHLAYQTNFDMEIKEDALFNYALLSHELALNPYNEAIDAFKKYITEFPASPRLSEAFEYLVKVYLTTRNFKDALESIEGIKGQNLQLKEAYQKICYNRGVELFNNADYEKAIQHFNKSLEFQIEKSLAALSGFWKAEAFYRLQNYESALKEYNDFIFAPSASITPYFNDAYYGMGYSYYKTNNYNAASTWLRKYISSNTEPSVILNDVLNRVGDCFFISKDYFNALDYYSKAFELKKINSDYSLYQKSLSLGLTGKNDEKIRGLEQLTVDYKNSTYQDNAKYELGKTFLLMNNNQRALEKFQLLVQDHPSSSHSRDAYLKMGLIFYNLDNDQEATRIYKKVIQDYPASRESKDALVGLKNIYIEAGKVEEFSTFVATVPFADLSVAALDSATYESAEIKFSKNGCSGGFDLMQGYLSRFPQGLFALNAEYYAGDCFNQKGEVEIALKYFLKVIERPRNGFTEASLARAAPLAMAQKDYQLSESLYNNLYETSDKKSNTIEGLRGIMKSRFNAGNYTGAMEAGEKLIKLEGITTETKAEAEFTIGYSAMKLEDWTLAIEKFLKTSKLTSSEMGAEAKYLSAVIWFDLKKYKEAEKLVFEIINQVPSYDYWIAKSFILLADLYSIQGDNFQARQTLQSIIDNYEGEELVNIAKERASKIDEFEKLKQSIKPPEVLEIDLLNEEENYQDLFDEK